MYPETNPDLQLAFDFVQFTNRNIFLTGKAGTGKTTFLRDLKIRSPKRMIILAPTGVAAINAGGVTIHSFFQLPFHPHVPVQYFPSATPSPVESSSFRLSRDKVRIIKGLDLLVIDEISMVRADLLDAVDMVLRRHKDKSAPFGGVQLLMIGDIQQLAPVAKHEEWALLEEYYDTPFFFSSQALRNTDYVTIELRYIYRQQDRYFIELLNKVRDNNMDTDALAVLNKRYDPAFRADQNEGYITLTTHNAQAQSINDSRLENLLSESRVFNALIKDEFPEFAYPTLSKLTLKTGAQVMFVKNDLSKDKLYFNGKIGRIEGFEKDRIMVQCPEDEDAIAVEMVEWQNMKYALNEETKEIDETVIGTFRQYPLKLAWAITIHKSQGLTFEKAIIDARAAFAHGQVYVALSRCRTLEGLVLITPVSRNGIISDPAVAGFVRECGRNLPDRKVLDESMKAYQKHLLNELFDFVPFIRGLHYSLKIIEEYKGALLGSPDSEIENAIGIIKYDLITVSEKFSYQIDRLLITNPDAESNETLQERIQKACGYFNEKLLAVSGIITAIVIETDNAEAKKSVNATLDRIRQEIYVKLACLERIISGFRISDYLETRAKASLESMVQKSKPAKNIEDASGVTLHPVLYNRIRKWRDRLAKETGVKHYMILHQKTIATLTTVLPQSMETLRTVKGMGNQKAAKYGEELIAIVSGYCSEHNIESPVLKIAGASSHVRKQPGTTRQVSLSLYREGKTIKEIAEERDMAIVTIEEHLAWFIGRGELSVTDFVSPDITELIAEQFEKTGIFEKGPVKEALGDQVTWTQIRFVARHLEYLNSKAQAAGQPASLTEKQDQ